MRSLPALGLTQQLSQGDLGFFHITLSYVFMSPLRRTYALLLRFSVTKKATQPCLALVRTAVGLKQEEVPQSLHPALAKAA